MIIYVVVYVIVEPTSALVVASSLGVMLVICIYVYTCVYIYIYIERERDR